METQTKIVMSLYLLISLSGVRAWTGEIHGRVVCDVCGDSLMGTEDHALEVLSSVVFVQPRFIPFDRQETPQSTSSTSPCDDIQKSSAWPSSPDTSSIGHKKSVEDLVEAILTISFVSLIGWSVGKLSTDTSGGAEVAVLCITKSGEVLNYQAFTNAKGIYTVAETMPESDRWDACLARPISSFHEHCTHHGDSNTGVKFSYNRPSGHSHIVKPFLYRPASVPMYCI
ncbi:hypothetical protein HHK36_003243 [Tetracentron sinense]|uniref:Pollen Ole e 1 allergen and extensin family protein n=1 Tax=Tetracentron sinense TaxID=13715 RepID=A0A834ZSZ7_TETSI|nr:hypothetical protein HHK36_003243 [Tetracentron sinense]